MLHDLTENSYFETTFNARWAAIQRYTNHGIRDLTGPGTWNFNCFAHALGLDGNPQFDKLVAVHGTDPEPLVPSRFIEHLKRQGILVPKTGDNYTPDDVVLYYDGPKLKHAARVVSANTTLVPKWGVGRIYEHGLFEVPASYGNSVQVLASPSVAVALSELTRWQAGGRK
jgi:hypothetical protein